MVNMGKTRLLGSVALCAFLVLILAASSNAALFGLVKSRAKSAPVVRHSLVVFPFDRDSESAAGVPDTFGTSVAESLRAMLAPSKGYSVLLYEDRLTPVVRAKTDSDSGVKLEDTKAPFFADRKKAGKMAGVLATDYYLVGSIESYSYDKDKKTADVTLKADLVQCKSGKLVQEFMVGGSAEAGTQAMEEEELLGIAAGKAVDALRERILSTSTADVKPVAAPAKPKK